MLEGVVVKAYNSYYYVQDNQKMIMCTLRGRFKKERFSLLVGDRVGYEVTNEDKGVIEEILPRQSRLIRPMVANVDQVVLTFAAANPDMNTVLIDRFLVLAELSHLEIILCINKMDYADIREVDPVIDLYRNIGYTVLPLAAKTGWGLEALRDRLDDKITVFAGPSGVGKSTLLNALQPGLALATGSVSEKIGRGKHTTRYVQLLPFAESGFVVDTPGFSLAEVNYLEEKDIMHCFREFHPLIEDCKFSSCLHLREPQCAVKQAVADGSVSQQRYDSYREIVLEIQANKKGLY